MTRYGLLYAEDFDRPAPAAREFNQAECDSAADMASAAAVAAARAAWTQADQHQRTQALSRLGDAMLAIQDAAAAQVQSVAIETARTMLTILASLLPALCARHGAAEVQAVLEQVLPALTQEKQVTLRVAPSVIEEMRPTLLRLEEVLAGAVTLLPDSRLAPGDVRLAWPGGSMARDTGAITGAVLAAVEAIGAAPGPITADFETTGPVASPAMASPPMADELMADQLMANEVMAVGRVPATPARGPCHAVRADTVRTDPVRTDPVRADTVSA